MSRSCADCGLSSCICAVVCTTCSHLRFVHQDDSAWCWVSACECQQFSHKRTPIMEACGPYEHPEAFAETSAAERSPGLNIYEDIRVNQKHWQAVVDALVAYRSACDRDDVALEPLNGARLASDVLAAQLDTLFREIDG